MDLKKRMEELERASGQHRWKISSLEKRVRLHRWIGSAACLAVVLGMWVIYQPKPDIIRARKFVLTDASGKNRSVWAMNKGNPYFMISDGWERQLILTLGKNGTALIIKDLRGKERLVVGSLRNPATGAESPGVFLRDMHANPQIDMVANEGKPELLLFNSIDKIRLKLGLSKDGKPDLSIYDDKENIVWSIPNISE